MPKILHHTFEEGGIAIWHITESTKELYSLLATNKYDTQLANKKNDTRKAEWLAVRTLIAELLGSEKTVAYHASGRPYLIDNSWQISISHTKNYAAIAYSCNRHVGIDIEYISSRVERIAHKFTNNDEASYIDIHTTHERTMLHLVNWSAKESLYKLIDQSEAADFRNAFFLHPYPLNKTGNILAEIKLEGNNDKVKIHYAIYEDIVCTWVFA